MGSMSRGRMVLVKMSEDVAGERRYDERSGGGGIFEFLV